MKRKFTVESQKPKVEISGALRRGRNIGQRHTNLRWEPQPDERATGQIEKVGGVKPPLQSRKLG